MAFRRSQVQALSAPPAFARGATESEGWRRPPGLVLERGDASGPTVRSVEADHAQGFNVGRLLALAEDLERFRSDLRD